MTMTRTFAALLFVLLTAGASAQVVSPIEQSYGPYPRPDAGYEPALAVSRDGILLAWSELTSPRHTQIRIGLLDFHGRLVSPISTVATEGNAASPAVTSDGTSFRVEYLEGDIPFAVDVDARGTVLSSPRQQSATTPSPLIARLEPPPGPIWCRTPCFVQPSLHVILRWSFLGKSGSHVLDKKEVIGPVSAGGSAKHFLLAWSARGGVSFLEYLDGIQTAAGVLVPASVNVWERPAVDCDDTHCLLAFATTSRQIHGVLIDPTRPHLIVPVPIETASRFEKPQVHVLENGRFLVTYVSAEDDPAHRFAGRIVTTAPLPRRRAVR